MRKMLNKKGFSLVELMIVVVIMGILIAVAIPLYGAITTSANNKTCATNIDTIENTVANYWVSHDQEAMPTLAEITGMMKDRAMPACPIDDGAYVVYTSTDGRCRVYCPSQATDDEHTPDGALTENAAPTDGTWTALS